MMFQRLDKRTLAILADDQETEIGRVILPEGVTTAELEKFIAHLKREATQKAHGPS